MLPRSLILLFKLFALTEAIFKKIFSLNVRFRYSQGGRGNFTYLLEGQINLLLNCLLDA